MARNKTSSKQNQEPVTQTQKPVIAVAPTFEANLKELETKCMESLKASLENVRSLAEMRLGAKLSSSRLTGVAHELRELIKVMSVYGC